MVPIFRMSAKLPTLGLRKIKVIQNDVYDVTTSVHNVTNKTLSRDSNYIVDVVMWSKFGYSIISMTKVIITSILRRFDQ